MVSTSQFKTGMIIKFKGEMCEVLEFQLVKMQQRQPIVRTRLRFLKSDRVLEEAFRSGDKFEEVYFEDKPLQYLYTNGHDFNFMNLETYNEVIVTREILGDKIKFLKNDSDAIGRFSDDVLISVELPPSVVLEITETEPGFRGDTAKSGTKPAKVETGATIKVPLFINTGEKVRIDTRTGAYVERA